MSNLPALKGRATRTIHNIGGANLLLTVDT
jgi:hypothetical protein